MGERWKYQIKTGIFWGIFMTVFMSINNEKSFSEQLNSGGLYVRIVINFLVGIFIMGYMMWKGQDPKNNSWKTFFGRNKEQSHE